MAFLDSISKKVTQVGQTTIQKTKDLTEIAKLHAQIDDETKKMNAVYITLGKLYVEEHSNDFEPGIVEKIDFIKASTEKIKEYKQQLNTLKGVSSCPKCGAEASLSSSFCSACGAPLEKAESDTDSAFGEPSANNTVDVEYTVLDYESTAAGNASASAENTEAE